MPSLPFPPRYNEDDVKRKIAHTSLTTKVRKNGDVFHTIIATCTDGKVFMCDWLKGEWTEWVKLPEIPQN